MEDEFYGARRRTGERAPAVPKARGLAEGEEKALIQEAMIYARPIASSTRFENLTVPSSEALSSTASRIAFHAASG